MQLDGTAKAAVFLLSLDEERAVKVIAHMEEQELQRLRDAVEKLGPIGSDLLESVYLDFAGAFKTGLTTMRGGPAYLHSLVSKARGEEEALRLLAPQSTLALPGGPDGQPGRAPFAALASADADAVALALLAEHPQVMAAVLAHLPPVIAGAVMEKMSPSQQCDTLRRVATLTRVPKAAFADAEAALGALDLAPGEMGDVDGVGSAAAILNELPTEDATQLLERLAETHPNEAAQLRKAMFTFEDLIDADKRGLQEMMRQVQSDTLMIALKTASEALKQKILGCMSTRAAAMLLEELAMMPPVRVADVEQAQFQIVELAMRLVQEGKLTIAGRGENMV
ncbi:MAG: hypothetical protein IT371_12545 [Deltaproteobacteria bacterium]|nr:hypothetical protein [Deltaproteobacteria bacterium]